MISAKHSAKHNGKSWGCLTKSCKTMSVSEIVHKYHKGNTCDNIMMKSVVTVSGSYLRCLSLFFALSLLEHGFSLLGPLNVPAHRQHALQWLLHWPAVRFSLLHIEHTQQSDSHFLDCVSTRIFAFFRFRFGRRNKTIVMYGYISSVFFSSFEVGNIDLCLFLWWKCSLGLPKQTFRL